MDLKELSALEEKARLRLFLLFYFLLCLVLSQFFFFPDVHWSGDSAIKTLQADILLRTGFTQVSIPYSSARWDPEGDFFPYIGAFVTQIEGRYYFSYPIFFAVLLALMKGLFGIWGGSVLVAAGSTLLLYCCYRLARQMIPERSFIALIVLAFASPVWIYSCLLWEHTLAAAGFTAGILFLLAGNNSTRKRNWIYAGILLAVATWIRTEGYGFTLAVLITLIIWGNGGWRKNLSQAGWVLIGFGMGLVPIWTLNAFIYGSVWGPHANQVLHQVENMTQRAFDAYFGGPRTRWIHRVSVFDWLFFRSTNYLSFSVKTAVPFLLFLITSLVPRLRNNSRWIRINLGLIGLIMLRVLWEVLSAYNRYVSGLFMIMPYCILAFWYLPCLIRIRNDQNSPVKFLIGLVVAFFFVSSFLNLGNKGGLQWGPRYLMPVFGILVVLAIKVADEERVFFHRLSRILVISLVGVAFILQIVGFCFARKDEEIYLDLIQYINNPQVVAVVGYGRGDHWLVQACSSLYFEKYLYYANSPEKVLSFLGAAKPFPNDRVVFLSRKKPLNDLVEDLRGQSAEITPGFWAWSPTKPETRIP